MRALGLSSLLLGFSFCLLGWLSGDLSVLGQEAAVDADERTLVLGGEAGIVADGAVDAGAGARLLFVDESGAGEERLGLDLQSVGDRLDHLGGRPLDAALD